MLKLTAVVSLMLIAIWSQADSKRHKKEATASGEYEPGSTLWAASLSCDSCGSECAAACGTRHFRSCCFNYLRRKRGPELIKYAPQHPTAQFLETAPNSQLPLYLFENAPDAWSTDFKTHPIDNPLENRLQIIYDV